MESPLGPLFLYATSEGLRGVFWHPCQGVEWFSKTADPEMADHLDQAVKQLEEYFMGKRKAFEIVLDLQGTEFQRSVWSQVREIPFGETRAYSEIAARLSTRAYRAIGKAIGQNPLCVVIPCHRVINANGTRGGYSGGDHRKSILLSLENSHRPIK